MDSEFIIHGTCDGKFEPLREVFKNNFEKGLEHGAAFSLVVDGEMMVNIWAGTANKKDGTPWKEDTLVNVYSTTKGMTALCAHRLVDQGKLDMDAPVAEYWPEFAQNGKDKIPVSWLLSHKAGLAGIAKPLKGTDLYEWDTMVEALAEQKPYWEPGTAHGYHAITFGFLVGEVVRRISGKSLGTFFREEVAGPLNIDFHIGLDEKHDGRCARMSPMSLSSPPAGGTKYDAAAQAQQKAFIEDVLKNPNSVTARAFMNPPILMQPNTVNTREWRAAEIPAANGHTTAQSLAKVYGVLARGGEQDGYRLLSERQIEKCYTEQSFGDDLVLKTQRRYGLGYMLAQRGPEMNFDLGEKFFGHDGTGGSFGYADPGTKVGFGYVMNKMGAGITYESRSLALMEALDKCI